MRCTVELPEALAQKLEAYLQEHPEESISSLVREALEIKLLPKDSTKLLELAGIVQDAPRDAADRAEDYLD